MEVVWLAIQQRARQALRIAPYTKRAHGGIAAGFIARGETGVDLIQEGLGGSPEAGTFGL